MKSLGNVTQVSCDLLTPIQMKLSSTDMNSITILVGQNGVGKTFFNKLVYFSSLTSYMHIKGLLKKLPVNEIKEHITHIFKGTFDAPEEITGSIKCEFENGLFECYVVEGVITTGSFQCQPEVVDASYPKYLSTRTRTFEGVENILNSINELTDDQISSRFKLYDMTHCLMLKQFATDIIIFPHSLVESLKGVEVDAVALSYDESNGKFTVEDSFGKSRFITSIGSGHQSLINMNLAVHI